MIDNTEPKIEIVNLPQIIKVRKYPVDTDKLCECLREHKRVLGWSNKSIAEYLNTPLTTVEHWFRQDEFFAIPEPEIWEKLKDLLDIETDEFDESIMVFEEKLGTYEKSERHYSADGIAPTITSAVATEKIIVRDQELVDSIDDRYGFVKKKAQEIINERGYLPNMFNPYNQTEITDIAPTQTTTCGSVTSSSSSVIMKDVIALDEQNGYLRTDGTVGCLTTDGSSPKHNNRIVEVINPLKGKSPYGWHFEQQVYDANGITRTVKANGGSGNIPKVIDNVRIRKLTPRECWRLMGFDDTDFDKAVKVNSNSQLYKQAGNSIVVNVLMAIFKGLLVPKKTRSEWLDELLGGD